MRQKYYGALSEWSNVLAWKAGVLQRHRRFESCVLRQEGLYSNAEYNLFYFCHKGVAGFVVPTPYKKPKPSLNYLKLKRNADGTWQKGKKL